MARVCVDVNVVSQGAPSDLEELNALAQEAAISLWVTAKQSRDDEPASHDSRLIAGCGNSEWLNPMPVLTPPTGPAVGLHRAIGLAEAGIHRVGRLCPTTHCYPLVDWVLSPLPELCERYGLALLLDFAPAAIPWVHTVAFARQYPTVPMVVLDCSPAVDRALPAALDAALNLVLHPVPTTPPGVLADLIEIHGTARFVAGSATDNDATAGRARKFPTLPWANRLAATAAALADGSYAGRHF